MPFINYSIIIPAYNEAKLIARCLHWVTESMAEVELLGEIIVVDNNSTDDTALIASNLNATVVFEPINQIARARNKGAKCAKGKNFIFLDADTQLTPALLRGALKTLNNQTHCGGGARLRLAGKQSGIGKAFFMWVVKSIQRSNSAAGCFIFCRSDAFFEIGGFNQKLFATEDYWFCRALSRWGKTNNLPFSLLKNQSIESSDRKFSSPFSLLQLTVPMLVPFFFYSKALCLFWYKSKR